MLKRLTVPKVSANVDEVTVTAWHRAEGDRLRKGEPVAEVTTDKAAFEIPSPAAGVLRAVQCPVKSVVPVGTVLAVVGAADDPLPDLAAENRALRKARGERRTRARRRNRSGGRRRTRVRATPAARRRAREADIDLADAASFAEGEVVDEAAVDAFLAARDKEGDRA